MNEQLDFFELLKSPLEKATNYEEIMEALGDECVHCIHDKKGTCCSMVQCVLGSKYKRKHN